ncbi:MAG: 2-phosphosulfolactate phosphatase family protein [Microscillaceae bacterium]
MKKIEVCLSPELLRHYEVAHKTVVVIDILRATTCIVTALAHGIAKVVPVAEIEECRAYQAQGYLTAAERNGDHVEGFDFGNSPLAYLDTDLKGRNLAMTTSNGTLALTMAKKMGAGQIVVGAFLNRSALLQYLRDHAQEVLLLCAGWKGRVNLEDSVFAGNVLDELLDEFQFSDDACGLARSAYYLGKKNPTRFLADSSHFQRLKERGALADIDFCLTPDQYDIVPVLQGEALVRLD